MPHERKPAGTASPQRTDRNAAAAQSTDPGPQQQHGQRKQLREAMEQQPLPNDTARFQQAMQAAQQMAPPQGGMRRPSERPDEPVTAGLPVGPGSMQRPAVSRGEPPAAASASQIAEFLPIMEAITSRPDASAASKAFVFRMRSQLPAGALFDGQFPTQPQQGAAQPPQEA